jgi:hypothetical protein
MGWKLGREQLKISGGRNLLCRVPDEARNDKGGQWLTRRKNDGAKMRETEWVS